jgi:outer membrane protein assembly factor BamB
VIWGNQLFVTGFDEAAGALEVHCLGVRDGQPRWRYTLRLPAIEKTHAVSNPATATPVVDEKHVYVYAGSYGVVALRHDGILAWSAPLPLATLYHGSGTSPILAGDLLVISRGGEEAGALLALDRGTGDVRWRAEYPKWGGETYATPLVFKDQIVVHRGGAVEAYDRSSGQRLWWVKVATSGVSTPVTDGSSVFVATWYNFGEADQRPDLPSFGDTARANDRDGDGFLSKGEVPDSARTFNRPDVPDRFGGFMTIAHAFDYVDANKDGKLDETEWTKVARELKGDRPPHGVIALAPRGAGDLTAQVAWREGTAVPEVPTPLLVNDRLFLVRNGGLVTILQTATGAIAHRSRLAPPGPYFASPILVDGKIVVASGDGVVSVMSSELVPRELSRNDLGEAIFATPAAAANRLFVRTARALYAFGDGRP